MKGEKLKGKITIDPNRCKGCELCIGVCPEGKIRSGDRVDKRGVRLPILNNENNCIGCSLCAVICPDVAIKVFRRGHSMD
jgi:2-oxoglutarate ferredoxin oxidoreductase subunit delta